MFLTTAAQSDKTPNRPPAKKVSKFPSLLCAASKHQATNDNITPPLQVSFVSPSSWPTGTQWTHVKCYRSAEHRRCSIFILPGHGAVSQAVRGPVDAIRLCPRHDRPQPGSTSVCPDQKRPAQRSKPVNSLTMTAGCWSNACMKLMVQRNPLNGWAI